MGRPERKTERVSKIKSYVKNQVTLRNGGVHTNIHAISLLISVRNNYRLAEMAEAWCQMNVDIVNKHGMAIEEVERKVWEFQKNNYFVVHKF